MPSNYNYTVLPKVLPTANFIDYSSFTQAFPVYYNYKPDPVKYGRPARPEKRGIAVNIAYFLIPKNSVAYLYDDFTFRQGLEKMRHHGYTAIPVITRDGRYVGTVSEGDFLWRILSDGTPGVQPFSMRDMEQLKIRDILRGNSYPPVRITVSMDQLLHSAMNQNFIPVVDDFDCFIGIVTRKDLIRRFASEDQSDEKMHLLRKIV